MSACDSYAGAKEQLANRLLLLSRLASGWLAGWLVVWSYDGVLPWLVWALGPHTIPCVEGGGVREQAWEGKAPSEESSCICRL